MTEPPREKKRGNDLGGRDWTRNSISIWNDIRFTSEERALKHPAMFPSMLVERVLRCFTRSSQLHILDPFLGSGSTLVAAKRLHRGGVGFDVYAEYIELARQRISTTEPSSEEADEHAESSAGSPASKLRDVPDCRLVNADAKLILEHVRPASIDLCVTSPPYWDILKQRRTADYKDIRDYGDGNDDLGTVADYGDFLDHLAEVFRGVFAVLKPKCYCVVNVMDLRKKSQFFPLHSDLATRLQSLGFLFDDLIVWDRRQEYNNLRPLGYPYVFRINKIHEFLLIMQKPAE
ncbi:MAG: DNA methyltransferase [Planctomycetota bacterium]|nr:DNA methyltransferase [Planctomycetota bacterium]